MIFTRFLSYARSSLRPLLVLALAAASVPAMANGQNQEMSAGLVVNLEQNQVDTTGSIDLALAQALASRLQRPLRTSSQSRIQLRPVSDPTALPSSRAVIPLNYQLAALAIVSEDNVIKSPEQLKNVSVCLAQGGHYQGLAQARFGALEKIYPTLPDALVALRAGDCQALIHDSPVLRELVRLPQWASYGTQLPLGAARTLAFVVPSSDSQTVGELKQAVDEWNAKSTPDNLARTLAANLAAQVGTSLQARR